jgi:hypothetical protein
MTEGGKDPIKKRGTMTGIWKECNSKKSEGTSQVQMITLTWKQRQLVFKRQWEVTAAVYQQLVLIRLPYHTIKAKKHGERKGQLKRALNFYNFMVVLEKY